MEWNFHRPFRTQEILETDHPTVVIPRKRTRMKIGRWGWGNICVLWNEHAAHKNPPARRRGTEESGGDTPLEAGELEQDCFRRSCWQRLRWKVWRHDRRGGDWSDPPHKQEQSWLDLQGHRHPDDRDRSWVDAFPVSVGRITVTKWRTSYATSSFRKSDTTGGKWLAGAATAHCSPEVLRNVRFVPEILIFSQTQTSRPSNFVQDHFHTLVGQGSDLSHSASGRTTERIFP